MRMSEEKDMQYFLENIWLENIWGNNAVREIYMYLDIGVTQGWERMLEKCCEVLAKGDRHFRWFYSLQRYLLIRDFLDRHPELRKWIHPMSSRTIHGQSGGVLYIMPKKAQAHEKADK